MMIVLGVIEVVGCWELAGNGGLGECGMGTLVLEVSGDQSEGWCCRVFGDIW